MLCCVVWGRGLGIFVHRNAIWCTNFNLPSDFVHEKGVWCTMFGFSRNFVHRMMLSCTKWACPLQTATYSNKNLQFTVMFRLFLVTSSSCADSSVIPELSLFAALYATVSMLAPAAESNE